jgi:hypothetical protein
VSRMSNIHGNSTNNYPLRSVLIQATCDKFHCFGAECLLED